MPVGTFIERDPATGLLVGSIPGVPGTHTQGDTAEDVQANLVEVLALLHGQSQHEHPHHRSS